MSTDAFSMLCEVSPFNLIKKKKKKKSDIFSPVNLTLPPFSGGKKRLFPIFCLAHLFLLFCELGLWFCGPIFLVLA